MKANAETARLADNQLEALDLLKSAAQEGLDTGDQATMDGLADIVAGRTYSGEEARAHMDGLINEIKHRQNAQA